MTKIELWIDDEEASKLAERFQQERVAGAKPVPLLMTVRAVTLNESAGTLTIDVDEVNS